MNRRLLAQIVSVVSALASIVIPSRADSVSVKGPAKPGHARPPLHVNVTPSTSVYYSPSQIRHAYGFDRLSATGAGEIIAIVDAYGNASIQSDLNTFCAQFGLPNTTVQILGSNSSVDAGWALETALDVEWAHAIAPGATILLSVAKSSSIVDLLNAVDAAVSAGASAVSMSWGADDFSGESFYDTHFNRAGITFTASSGDSGAGVEWPAVSPYVLSVGGTSLYLDASNNRSSEAGWSGSGGGSSGYVAIPGFQGGWQSTSGRGVPDVSYLADPNTGVLVYDSVYGGWYSVGGTSAGAPQWAALVALVNQMHSPASLGTANQALYSLAKGSSTTPYTVNSTYFYDVSQGSNGAYTAGPPYDFVTGLGSPIANALVPALSGAGTPDFSLSVAPSSQSIVAGAGAVYTVSVGAIGGFNSAVTLSVSGLPSGASSSFSTNPLFPGSSTLTVSTAANTPPGSYTLAISGASSSLTHSMTATLVVGGSTTSDFTISATPTSRVIKHGSNTSYSITVSATGGFAGAVGLSGTVSAGGPGLSFSPSTISNGSGTAQLTVSSSGGGSRGNYTIRITGTSGNLTHSTSVSLRIN